MIFGEVFKAAKSLTDLTDAAVGIVVKPVKDGADLIAEGLREVLEDDDERRAR